MIKSEYPSKNIFLKRGIRQIGQRKYLPWVNPLYPVTYLLEDFQGQPIAGGFYEQELQKTSYPDEYSIEKIIKRRGKKLYVKWKGFDHSYNRGSILGGT